MIQVYTGNGKGKTTAALGSSLRAAGAGLKVYIAQFAKGCHYSELNALVKIKNIKVEQFGSGCFIKKRPARKDIELAQAGLNKVREIIKSRKYELIILDEINIAVHLNLIALKDVVGILKSRPKDIELVLTGRYAHPEIIKLADLVSNIKEVKHYYKQGVKARKGFEI